MIGYGLAAIGPGVGVGLIFAAYINGVARQPEARGVLPGHPDPRLRPRRGARPHRHRPRRSSSSRPDRADDGPHDAARSPPCSRQRTKPNPLLPHTVRAHRRRRRLRPPVPRSCARRSSRSSRRPSTSARDAIEGGMERAEAGRRPRRRRRSSSTGQQLAEARHEAARLREEAREQGAAIIAEMRERGAGRGATAHRRRRTQQIEADRRRPLRAAAPARSARSPSTWPAASSASPSRTTPGSAGVVDRFLDELEAQAAGGSAAEAGATRRSEPRGAEPPAAASARSTRRDARHVAGDADLPARRRAGRGRPRCSTARAALRRALTDPARTGEAGPSWLARLLGGQVGGATVDVVVWAVAGPLVAAARPGRRARAARASRPLVGRGRARRPARRRRGRAVPVRPDRRRRAPSCAPR